MLSNNVFRWFLLGILLISQGIIASSNSVIKLDCARIKTGFFYYEPAPGLLIIIERMQDEQTQHRLFNKLYKRETVTWIDSCSYRIQTTEKHDPILESEDTSPTIIQILNIFGNHYEYKEFKNNVWSDIQKMYFLTDIKKAINYQIQNTKED